PRHLHSLPTRRSSDLIDDRLTMAAAIFDAGHPELAVAVKAAVEDAEAAVRALAGLARDLARAAGDRDNVDGAGSTAAESAYAARSEEHTSELQSRENL